MKDRFQVSKLSTQFTSIYAGGSLFGIRNKIDENKIYREFMTKRALPAMITANLDKSLSSMEASHAPSR